MPGRQWRGDRYNVRGAPTISTVRVRLPRLASAVAPCPGRRSRSVSNYNLKIIMTFAVLVVEAAGAHDDGAEISTCPGVKQALQPDACDGPEATVPHSAGALSSSRPTCIASFRRAQHVQEHAIVDSESSPHRSQYVTSTGVRKAHTVGSSARRVINHHCLFHLPT